MGRTSASMKMTWGFFAAAAAAVAASAAPAKRRIMMRQLGKWLSAADFATMCILDLAPDIFKTRRSTGEIPPHPAFGEVWRLPRRLQSQCGRISAPIAASPSDRTHGLSRAALGRG